jgi:geranylgeranyl diphosphate synthase type I
LEEFLPRRFDEATVERIVGPATWKHEPEAYTETISRPVWDLIDRSGKRWRPIFGLLMLEALGVSSKPYEALISNMTELIHTGALIVDDIEDQSKLRRGEACLHLRYDIDVALNAANMLYFLPAQLLLQHPNLSPDTRLRLHAIRERSLINAHGGQSVDIYWSREMSSKRLDQWLQDGLEDRILQMYAMKTGAGVMGLAEFAAVIANADEETTAGCVDFARSFAVAFQIVDDVHNFSRSPRWSKVCGEDLVNGKLTYVIATALRRLDPERSERLRSILCDRQLRSDSATLEQGIELIHKSGALGACRKKARSLSKQGWTEFSQHVRSSEAKIMLHAMCYKLLDLAYDI